MLLCARDVVGGYRGISIVRGVSLSVDAGQSVAVLGRNGMGKTTLLRTLLGFADRYEGAVEIDGAAVPPRAPAAAPRAGIAFVPDDRGVFARLSVAENLELARRCAYAPAALEPMQLFPDLARLRRQAAGTLSGGQQQQLAIARALATGPRLLVVDELSQGLQPSLVVALADALRMVSRELGVSLILVEQNPSLALEICERVVVIESGTIVAERDSTDAATRPDFVDLLAI